MADSFKDIMLLWENFLKLTRRSIILIAAVTSVFKLNNKRRFFDKIVTCSHPRFFSLDCFFKFLC